MSPAAPPVEPGMFSLATPPLFAALAAARSVLIAGAGGGGRQRIHLDLYVRPSYSRDSFHLSLRVSVAFPEMAKVGAALLGSHAAGFGKSGTVDIAALDHIQKNPPMMLFQTAGDLNAFATDIERHLTDVIVPYLDDRDTIAKLTAANSQGWSQNTPEPGTASRLPVIVAAGQLAMDDPESAMKTLETAYPDGTPGRARFGDAFAVTRAAASRSATS
jgi:hypothetical protein